MANKNKVKQLTEEQLKKVKKIYENKSIGFDERIKKVGNFLGLKSERYIRRVIKGNGLDLKVKVEESEDFKIAKKRKINKSNNIIMVTWGQNNTAPHTKFFENLEAYANYHNAELLVIAGKYLYSDTKNIYWDSKLKPYLDANSHAIHKHLTIESGVPISATATNPLSGLTGFAGNNSTIFGHPKVQLETVPVLENERPKTMITTGACTIENYSDTKSGAKSKFHHQLGFAIIEIKDKETYFLRQVTALENGSFTDLCYNVKDKKINKINEIEACIMGDLHLGQHEQGVLDQTHYMLSQLKPKHVVLHDVFDGKSISHHEMKDPFIQYAKEVNGTNDLKEEIDEMLEHLKPFTKYKNVAVVKSNHDEVVDKWLKNEDWKKQPTMKNSLEYMEYSTMLLKQYAKGDPKGVIPELIERKYPKFKTLDRRKGYKIKGFECGYHGDVANNGARGSLLGFRKLNTKCVVGHYHAPGRKDGALAVGTTTKLRLSYNIGGSSWAHAHVIIHKDGKAQHVFFDPETYEFTTFM